VISVIKVGKTNTMSRAPRLILLLLSFICLTALTSLWQSAYAQSQHRKEATKKEEQFDRPKPTQTAKPEIPGANRYQEDKVFLEQAEVLFRPENEMEELQVVQGDVKFRHGSMWMFCDSAYYYPERNSLNAFGHVQMKQGDTLFVYADHLYYDGFEKHATLVRGPSRNNVQLKDPKVTLTTDSLDYNLNEERGWYTTGGRLEDDLNTLTSVYGEYSPASKQALFSNDVLLVNRKDGYRLTTEQLNYNTGTHIADINTFTRIEGATDTILTTRGTYDTQRDHAELTARSTIFHRDSAMNVTTLEGDSIIYDKKTRTSRAYMFSHPSMMPRPMVLTDTARKVTLIGGYGEYNDSTRAAFSTKYPLLIEYSRPDSLFLRADTIYTRVVTQMVWPDSLSHGFSAATRARLRAYPDLASMGGDIHLELLLLPRDIQAPVESTEAAEAAGAAGANGATEATEVAATPEAKGETKPVYKPDPLGRDSLCMVPKDFHIARAIKNARFFNKDIQGIADTLIFREMDSMLYMLRKPIVWSGERQVYGNRIDVHFNDSTADWAHLPESGMCAEHVDEDFYNQLSGTDLMAYFEGENLKHLDVSGNVQTIFLPQENDSTYNKLITAESSYLSVDMKGKDMEHLKMWPEVNGTVTPLFEVKKSQQFLQGFSWYEALRPKRRWYGNHLSWEDELGDVSDELEKYFNEAPTVVRKQPTTPFDSMRGGAATNKSMMPKL
jgi:hypothetical protein